MLLFLRRDFCSVIHLLMTKNKYDNYFAFENIRRYIRPGDHHWYRVFFFFELIYRDGD